MRKGREGKRGGKGGGEIPRHIFYPHQGDNRGNLENSKSRSSGWEGVGEEEGGEGEGEKGEEMEGEEEGGKGR